MMRKVNGHPKKIEFYFFRVLSWAGLLSNRIIPLTMTYLFPTTVRFLAILSLERITLLFLNAK